MRKAKQSKKIVLVSWPLERLAFAATPLSGRLALRLLQIQALRLARPRGAGRLRLVVVDQALLDLTGERNGLDVE